MTIIHQNVKIRYAGIYEPETKKWDGTPHPLPMAYVGAWETDNPDRPELPWRESPSGRSSPSIYYRSSQRPRVTLRDGDYSTLVETLDVFRARNIAPDVLFRGAYADIVIAEYQKDHGEIILQLSELIFETVEALNLDGDMNL